MAEVGVLGFGTMGTGIAQLCAQAGHDVVVVEASEERLQAGFERLDALVRKGVDRGKLSVELAAELRRRIEGATDVGAAARCSVVVESVTEDADVKRAVLADLSAAVASHALVATNTSALSVTGLASAVVEPARFVGLHFFNPAPVMPLIEVVRALQSSHETVARAQEFAASLEKEVVTVGDRPGFMVNSLLMPYLNQAISELDAGLAAPEEIDKALRLGLGYPMGPFELLDLIGLDTHRHATTTAYEQTGDPLYAAPPLLDRMVAAGWLGRKSGIGFVTGEVAR